MSPGRGPSAFGAFVSPSKIRQMPPLLLSAFARYFRFSYCGSCMLICAVGSSLQFITEIRLSYVRQSTHLSRLTSVSVGFIFLFLLIASYMPW